MGQQTTGCSSWNINGAVATLKLGYTLNGVTYLKITTSAGANFEKGSLKSTDSVYSDTYN